MHIFSVGCAADRKQSQILTYIHPSYIHTHTHTYVTGRKMVTERRFWRFDSMGGTMDSACAAPSIDPSKAASSDLASNCHLPFRQVERWNSGLASSAAFLLVSHSGHSSSTRQAAYCVARYATSRIIHERLKATTARLSFEEPRRIMLRKPAEGLRFPERKLYPAENAIPHFFSRGGTCFSTRGGGNRQFTWRFIRARGERKLRFSAQNDRAYICKTLKLTICFEIKSFTSPTSKGWRGRSCCEAQENAKVNGELKRSRLRAQTISCIFCTYALREKCLAFVMVLIWRSNYYKNYGQGNYPLSKFYCLLQIWL